MAVEFPIDNILVEGCDLGGKSTIYRQIHDGTNYKWNIIDRSTLSRMAYAEHYERESTHDEYLFWSELSHLNNRLVILHPSFEEIERRYKIRGDEFQNLDSLKSLHGIFSNWRDRLKSFPTVMCLDENGPGHDVKSVIQQFQKTETCETSDIARMVYDFVNQVAGKEVAPLTFAFYDDGNFESVDSSEALPPGEAEYYESIRTTILRKIRHERESGQDLSSRRFVYADGSCLSLLHAVYRDGILDLYVVLRSSNVKTLLKHDLAFIHRLGSQIFQELELSPVDDQMRFRVQINSAHIL